MCSPPHGSSSHSPTSPKAKRTSAFSEHTSLSPLGSSLSALKTQSSRTSTPMGWIWHWSVWFHWDRMCAGSLGPSPSHHHPPPPSPLCFGLTLKLLGPQTIISDLVICHQEMFWPALCFLQLGLYGCCWDQARSWHSPTTEMFRPTHAPQNSLLICCCVPTWRHLQISPSFFFAETILGLFWAALVMSLSDWVKAFFHSLLLYCFITRYSQTASCSWATLK